MKVTRAATEYVVHMYIGIIGPRHAILKSTTATAAFVNAVLVRVT